MLLDHCLNYVGKRRHLVHIRLKKKGKNILRPFFSRRLLVGKLFGVFLTEMYIFLTVCHISGSLENLEDEEFNVVK